MTGPQEFGPHQRDVLLRVVKDCQKTKIQGAQGSWKVYLKLQKLSKTDPALQSWQVCRLCFSLLLFRRLKLPYFLQTLAGFLATLSRPQVGVLLGRRTDWEQHQQQVVSRQNP